MMLDFALAVDKEASLVLLSDVSRTCCILGPLLDDREEVHVRIACAGVSRSLMIAA